MDAPLKIRISRGATPPSTRLKLLPREDRAHIYELCRVLSLADALTVIEKEYGIRWSPKAGPSCLSRWRKWQFREAGWEQMTRPPNVAAVEEMLSEATDGARQKLKKSLQLLRYAAADQVGNPDLMIRALKADLKGE